MKFMCSGPSGTPAATNGRPYGNFLMRTSLTGRFLLYAASLPERGINGRNGISSRFESVFHSLQKAAKADLSQRSSMTLAGWFCINLPISFEYPVTARRYSPGSVKNILPSAVFTVIPPLSRITSKSMPFEQPTISTVFPSPDGIMK